MSLGRRSERSTKKVNYTQFCNEEGDEDFSTNSDDDFQDSPGPPIKKRKVVDKPNSKPKQDEMSSKKKEPPKKKERLSLEDKIYRRELEAALEASRRESSQDDSKSVDEEDVDSEQEDSNDIHPRLKQDRAKLTSTSEDNDKENNSVFEENKPRKVKSSEVDSELKSDTATAGGNTKKTMPASCEEDNEVHFQDPKQEKDAVEAQTGNGSDFDLEKDNSDNESFGQDEAEESDFEELGKKPRKTQSRVEAPPATSARPSIKPRTNVTVTPIKMRKWKKRGKAKGLSAASGAGYSPSLSSSASNSPSTKNSSSLKNSSSVSSISSLPLKFSSVSTKRSSLGTGLGGVNIRTSRPPIRLGLSRNVRVKPLHPNVTVSDTDLAI